MKRIFLLNYLLIFTISLFSCDSFKFGEFTWGADIKDVQKVYGEINEEDIYIYDDNEDIKVLIYDENNINSLGHNFDQLDIYFLNNKLFGVVYSVPKFMNNNYIFNVDECLTIYHDLREKLKFIYSSFNEYIYLDPDNNSPVNNEKIFYDLRSDTFYYIFSGDRFYISRFVKNSTIIYLIYKYNIHSRTYSIKLKYGNQDYFRIIGNR